MKIPPGIWLLARVFTGLVYFYAGASKLLDPIENFRGAVAQYDVVPYVLVPAIAVVLPWLEFLFGAFLILGYAVRVSAFVLGGLSLGFLLVLGSSNVLLDAGGADCGCFGERALIHLTVHQVFLLDLLNFFITLKLFRMGRHLFSFDGWLQKPSAPKA